MIRRPPRSTLFPTRRSSDLECAAIFPVREVSLTLENAQEREHRVVGRLRIDQRGDHFADARFALVPQQDRKSTRLNSSHLVISYAVFCLKKKKKHTTTDALH